LWGKLKSVVYANNPNDLQALKQNIREAIYDIQQCELQHVSRNLFKRIQACLTTEGRNMFPEICLKEFRHNRGQTF
jgi:hypothetical protein